jgi:hypothetical protein
MYRGKERRADRQREFTRRSMGLRMDLTSVGGFVNGGSFVMTEF